MMFTVKEQDVPMRLFEQQHPAQQLAGVMSRLYAYHLTTTSGGNLSCRDDSGSLWITPGSVDKANLTSEDIIHISPKGAVTGKHKPSLETQFHQGAYAARSDAGAVIHAHAPSLSAFCIQRTAPDLRTVPQILLECGSEASMSGYAVPGSALLSEQIASQLRSGSNAVLLDNHGALTVGSNLLHALQRFEALDVCAKIVIEAQQLGGITFPKQEVYDQLSSLLNREYGSITEQKAYEKERSLICTMARRAYDRGLMTSSLGSLSIRVEEDAFLITPWGRDRHSLTPDEIVLVKGDRIQGGFRPDLWTFLHREVYLKNSSAGSVMTAVPPSAMAFAVSGLSFDARTLTEGYVLLRDVKTAELHDALQEPERCAARADETTPVQLISHGGIFAVGTSALQALDRIEVAEVSMRAALWAAQSGPMHALDDREIAEIKSFFSLS